MTTNPYPRKPGFGIRYRRAKLAYEIYGRDYSRKPYSRAIDNCFEMDDGDAVVWALMKDAIAGGNIDLAEGIQRTGKDVWPHWLEVYEQRGKYAPRQQQLNLSLIQAIYDRPKPPRPG